MVLINGWYFDFKNMRAIRASRGKDHSRIFLSTDYYSLISVGTPPSILKCTKLKGPFGNFFDEPEDNYNDIIDMKYREFLLSEEIEKLLVNDG
jgi:hypothetical protein